MDPLELLQEFVAVTGPPGEEERIRLAVARRVEELGLPYRSDPRGNLLVGDADARVLVTAHLDEIAMLVRDIQPDGKLVVGPLGGLFPWKLGEGPVQLLSPEPITGILSFGSIHTEDPRSVVRQAEKGGLDWSHARVITRLDSEELKERGVRPGTRVVVHPSRRTVTPLGDCVSGYFLDDRADLVSWLLALKELKELPNRTLFAATAAEEVGGLGALWQMLQHPPEVCIALELGPVVPDTPAELSPSPTLWVNDGYSAMQSCDIEFVSEVARDAGIELQYQALSRGGSDASCAASRGFCARPITLGLAMENSHGYEIMHMGAMAQLGRLTAALVRRLAE